MKVNLLGVHQRNPLAHLLLDNLKVVQLLIGNKRYGFATLVGPARAAYPVNVVLGRARKLVVNYEG